MNTESESTTPGMTQDVPPITKQQQNTINQTVNRAPRFAREAVRRELAVMFRDLKSDSRFLFEAKNKSYQCTIQITSTASELGHNLIVVDVTIHPTAKDVVFTTITEA